MIEATRVDRARSRSTYMAWCAAVAVAIYVGATILGGLLDPAYSHVSMHVSELTGSQAPNRVSLAALYIAYNAALGGLGLTLLGSLVRSKWVKVASWSLVAVAVTGVLLVTWFPQDSYAYGSAPRCPLQPPTCTTAGTVHIWLGAVTVLLIILAMVAAGRAFRLHPSWATLGRLSTVAAVAMLLTGLAGVVAPAAASSYAGLLERLPIGTFLLWLVAVAWYALRHPPALPMPKEDTADRR